MTTPRAAATQAAQVPPVRFRPSGWPLPVRPGEATLFGPVDERRLTLALRDPLAVMAGAPR